MQLSNAPGKLVLPFANAGAKNTIPTASQIGITAGAASLTDGFPPLTRTPIAAGGVPPSGLDMNGILYALSAAIRWANAGGGYVYDSTFAADSNVGGYPKGARVLRSDGAGYWLNTIDGNTVDPESVTVNQAQIAGWVPDLTNGVAAVTMTSANVTLTPLQYGKPIIVLSGTLTANLNLIFPNLAGEWTVVNNCTGAFTVTAKTAAGTGVVVTPGRTRIIYGDGTNIAGAMNEVETPAQFDATTKIATMAAVQRALGNYNGYVIFNTNQVLTNVGFGGIYESSGSSSLTLQLPSATACPAGCVMVYNGQSSGTLTVSSAGGIFYGPNNPGGTSTVVLYSGQQVEFVSDGTNWKAVNGAGSFVKTSSTNGHARFSNGLILQFGQGIFASGGTVTQAQSFPVAFPNECLTVNMGSWENANNNDAPVQFRSPTTTGFTAYCFNSLAGATGYSFLAIGR